MIIIIAIIIIIIIIIVIIIIIIMIHRPIKQVHYIISTREGKNASFLIHEVFTVKCCKFCLNNKFTICLVSENYKNG